MGTRIISASFLDFKNVYNEDSVNFTDYVSFGDPVSGGSVTGGTITFTDIRTNLDSYYFKIYINGEPACESVEATTVSFSPYTLVLDIDMKWELYEDVLLGKSGTITVQAFDNKNTGDRVCRFDYSSITIRVNHNVSVTPPAPTFSQSNDGKVIVSWGAATTTGGTGDVTYTLVYGEDGNPISTGTARSTTITIPSSWYGQSIRFYVHAEYSGTYGASSDAYFSPSYPTLSAPSN